MSGVKRIGFGRLQRYSMLGRPLSKYIKESDYYSHNIYGNR
jgi:hypothetical protein